MYLRTDQTYKKYLEVITVVGSYCVFKNRSNIQKIFGSDHCGRFILCMNRSNIQKIFGSDHCGRFILCI